MIVRDGVPWDDSSAQTGLLVVGVHTETGSGESAVNHTEVIGSSPICSTITVG